MVNLAAMFIHFYKQSKFIVNLTDIEIKNIESRAKDNNNQQIFKEVSESETHKKSYQAIINK
jgi:hypothetical protein